MFRSLFLAVLLSIPGVAPAAEVVHPCTMLAELTEATLRDRNVGGLESDSLALVEQTDLPPDLKSEALRLIPWLYRDPKINTLPPATASAIFLGMCLKSKRYEARP